MWFWTWRRLSSGSVSLWFGPGRRTSASQGRSSGAWWVLRAPEASAVRRMCGRAAHDRHGHLARVSVESLASTDCVADASSEVTKNYPPQKLRVFVEDIAALLMGKKQRHCGNGKEGDEEAEGRSREKKTSNCQSRKMGRTERARR